MAIAAARIHVGEPPTYARRSVVKASFSRNRWSGAWAAHARYLGRPGAQQEFAKGLGFDAEHEDVDLAATVRGWEKADELLWRFIVSPEDADRLNLRDHVRELTAQMERDFGTKLQWVAIDHHNTDDAHVHLLVRGVREHGRPLEINRDYLRSGLRIRSQEIATRELGPRLEPEMLRARERAVRREQWTELDRALQHKADRHRRSQLRAVSAAQRGRRGFAPSRNSTACSFSADSGWRKRIDDHTWQLATNHERELRERQRVEGRHQEPGARAQTGSGPRAGSRPRTTEAESWLNNVPIAFPGSAFDARLARVKRLAILSLVAAFLAINQVTTQHAARVLGYAGWLGQPIFHLPVVGPVYAPWAWITWWRRWYWAPAAASTLDALCVASALADWRWSPESPAARLRLSATGGSPTSRICMVRPAGPRRVTSARHGSSIRLDGCGNRRRVAAHATGSAAGRDLSRPLAAMGPPDLPARLRSRPCAGVRADPVRQRRRHRDPDPAHVAAFRARPRPQGRELGADRRARGNSMGQLCLTIRAGRAGY